MECVGLYKKVTNAFSNLQNWSA